MLPRLKKRSDFLRVAKERVYFVTPSVIIQLSRRPQGEEITRVGFTASKKIGKAVIRNRAKRRLREVAEKILANVGLPAHKNAFDVVLIARWSTAKAPFQQLLQDCQTAFENCLGAHSE